jgi:hypothetical protein
MVLLAAAGGPACSSADSPTGESGPPTGGSSGGARDSGAASGFESGFDAGVGDTGEPVSSSMDAGSPGGDDSETSDAGPTPTGDDAGSTPTGDDAGAEPESGSDAGDSTAMTCPMLTAGWMPYQPTAIVQFEDGTYTTGPAGTDMHSPYCTYTNSGGIELFKMLKDPAGRIQRCEERVQNEYTSGSNQFEGDVRVTAGNATCVHQVFLFLMLDAFPGNGGELHDRTGPVLSSGVFGKWVHVNTIHHVASGGADIYLDCVKKVTVKANPPTGTGWYNKYGVYAVNHAPPVDPMAQSEWKNVKFYRQ